MQFPPLARYGATVPRTARGARLRPWTPAAFLLVLALAPLYLPLTLVNDLGQAMCMGLFAIGFNVVFDGCGLLSFGHAVFFGIAAYAQAQLLQHFPGLPLVLLIPAASLASALAGAVSGQVCVRRQGTYFSMTTLAIAALAASVAYKWQSVTGGTDGLGGFLPARLVLLPGWSIEPPGISGAYWLIAAVTFASAALVWALLALTPFGNAVRAVRDNEERAAFLGYGTHRVKLGAYVVGAALAGVGGALWAIDNRFVSTDSIDLGLSTTVILMTLIGGRRWFWGPLAGAIVYIAAGDWLSKLTSHWQLLLGIVFIGVVQFAPDGLAGCVRATWRRLAERRHG
jgi:ABC-type branched-subunit amino acid transport system permease subunit